MVIPVSPHFSPISLERACNADRAELNGGLALREGGGPHADWSGGAFGERAFRGVPFDLGQPGRPNVILLAPGAGEVRVATPGLHAAWLVVLHAVEDRSPEDPVGLAPLGPIPGAGDDLGNRLGDLVSTYALAYADGTAAATPVLRRFAIQQRHVGWGASPFAAVPAVGPLVFSTASEDAQRGRPAARTAGRSEIRHDSGRLAPGENLWLYALSNPRPDEEISAIVLQPGEERSIVYGVSATTLSEHPLRPGVRRTLRLELPDGVALDRLGELDADSRDPAIAIDLGTVISARAALDYDHARWLGPDPDVQPATSSRAVLVEFAAHPAARIHLATGPGTVLSADLAGDQRAAISAPALRWSPVAAAERPVRIRVVDAATGQAVPVRLHLHDEAGQYLPPRGHHRLVNPLWWEDTAGEFVNGANQYAYIPGECMADLPPGRVFVQISRGFEVAPIRTVVEIGPETHELRFELERTLRWRERGWVTADTHVHFLSPQTALLEGAAEGVNVVNLLAAQWGELFTNVADFDGRTTLGAREFGGDGEFLVRVGTENRMQVLGHISLLGYSGRMIDPLSTAGPAEGAIGDPLAVTMAEWAERCIAQGGLVVLPHAPNPQAERVADMELGLVHAIEMMTFNPYDAQVNPYGLADWYRSLDIGHHIPLVAGSDKMTAASLLGGIRTYAHLGDRPFDYPAWMDAVRAGNTFVTVGPLIEFAVEGRAAGSVIDLPDGGGRLEVTWRIASVATPIERVEGVVGGLVAADADGGGEFETSGSAAVRVDRASWIALRVRGSLRGRKGEIAAHTSAVQVRVGGRPPFAAAAASAVLDQIEGALAYVDTVAPRPEAERLRALRATLERAHRRLHARLHADGVVHRHVPLHPSDPGHGH
ncbi:MAG: CehA/McbA family metallohydrolase [Chloroflexota bacterium]